MLIPDVNVLVAAYRTDAASHVAALRWLESAIRGPEVLGLSDAVLTGWVRVATNSRIYREPSSLKDALDRLEQLRSAEGTQRVAPGRGYWSIFSRLCIASNARGNLVADAAHAALAVESGATWVTFDRDFARFPGLSWRAPA